jgi:serine/threonine protein phosphatase PrpC
MLATNPHHALEEMFTTVNEELLNDYSWDSYLSGTTAVLTILVDNYVHVGHVGDSQLFIVSENDQNWSIRKVTV